MASLKKSSRDTWWELWQPYITKLRTALQSNSSDSDSQKVLMDCLDAYKGHLHVSSKDEALAVVTGDGCTSVEIAFMWMGRWRPTSAVVLVYSTMGLNPLEEATKEKNANVDQDFAIRNPFSKQQLSRLNDLQKYAFQAESDISQQLAVLQMLLVEQNAVTALHLDVSDLSDFQQLINMRLVELQNLLQKADELRLHTLRVLLDLLTPVQGLRKRAQNSNRGFSILIKKLHRKLGFSSNEALGPLEEDPAHLCVL